MNRGVLAKSLREAWFVTVVLAVAMALAEGLIAFALPRFFSEYAEQLLQLKFLQRIIAGLLGADVGGPITEDMIRLFAWVHPVPLALLWTQTVWSATRVPAAEIDRGTIDLLLSLPTSRWSIYVTDGSVTVASGLVLVFAAALGNAIATAVSGPRATGGSAPSSAIAANFFCMHLAVAGLASLSSALSDRRGRAVAGAVAALLASFLLSFLAQFWDTARAIDVLSILHYYRPMRIASSGAWPFADMAILTGIGVALWLLGGVCFARRDLRTV